VRDTTEREGLAVLAISTWQWIVSDPDKDHHDGTALLGYIERVDGVYEVTPLADPASLLRCSTMTDALESLQPHG